MWHVWETGEVYAGLWWGKLSERAHLEDLGNDNSEMDLQEVGWGGTDWTALSQDKDRWQVLVNVVMNFWFP
jgi:hypothetical protein